MSVRILLRNWLRFWATAALVIVSVLSTMVVAYASDISDAVYIGTVRVHNDSMTATAVSTSMSLSTQGLIDRGYMADNATNTAIRDPAGNDTTYMPAPGAGTTWAVWVDNITGYSASDYNLYLGGATDMNSRIAYFPGSAGMATTDNASLELSSNFTIQQYGYINTSASAAGTWLVSKPAAFRTTVYTSSISSSVLSAFLYEATLNNLQPLYTGNVTRAGQRVNGVTGTFDSVDLRLSKTGSPAGSVTVTIRRAADDVILANMGTVATSTLTASAAWYTFVSSALVSVAATDIRIVADYAGGDAANYVNVYLRTTDGITGSWTTYNAGYTDDATKDANIQLDYVTNTITAAAVTSGEHTVKTVADGATMKLYVDDVEQASMAVVAIPNTAHNWIFTKASAMPYMFSHNVTVGGTLVQRIEWENDSSTFTDLSGNGNDATPTFLTSSSDADVWAELLDFGPIDPAESTGAGGAAGSPAIVDTPDQPSNMYTELSVTFPGAAFVNAVVDGAGIPRALVWFPFFIGLILLISFATFWGTKSTVMKAVVLWLCFLMVAAMGGWGWWILIPLAIEEWATVVAMKKAGW